LTVWPLRVPTTHLGGIADGNGHYGIIAFLGQFFFHFIVIHNNVGYCSIAFLAVVAVAAVSVFPLTRMSTSVLAVGADGVEGVLLSPESLLLPPELPVDADGAL
jgi:hypothetical protein